MSRKRVAIFLAVLLLSGSPALAQQSETRIQGVPVGGEAAAPVLGSSAATLDLREQMRKLIQDISAYARKLKPNFVVIPQNGLELLVKQDISNPDKTAPAYTYIRSIDGVLQDEMFFGTGKPREKDAQIALLKLTEAAKDGGLRVFTIDYAKDPKKIDESIRLNSEKGFTPFVAHQPMAFLNSIPPYPARPFRENPKSVLSLRDARNFLLLKNTAAFGRQDEFALKIHDTNYDIVVVDTFHGRRPLSKKAVATLKYKKVGGKRLVFAHIDIGSAASYNFYWKPHWREGSPQWITAPHRDDPDKYFVKYWQPEWQSIIFGSPTSYIYGLIDQGYDGVVMDGAETFRFFETGSQGEEEEQ